MAVSVFRDSSTAPPKLRSEGFKLRHESRHCPYRQPLAVINANVTMIAISRTMKIFKYKYSL